MDAEEARRRLAAARIATLGTVGPRGRVDLVPVTFAVVDGGPLVTAVDHKPKRSTRLQRLANVRRDPRVTVLVDEWHEDWTRLWWVRARGRARVVEAGEEREAAVDALCAKYDQYRNQRPAGPAVVVAVDEVRGWSAAGD